MMKTKRTLKGLAFTAVLALSLVATSVPAFAAQTSGDGSALAAKRGGRHVRSLPPVAPTSPVLLGVSWEGVSWEGVTWEGISWE